MSEIQLKCPGCDRVYCVPDHIADMTIKCWECGETMTTDGPMAPVRLDTGFSYDDADEGPDTGLLRIAHANLEPERLPMRSDCVQAPAPSALETVLEGAVEVEDASTWPGYIAFAMTFGIMLLYQFQAAEWRSYMDFYVWGRGIAVAGLFVYITFSAMHDNGWKGALCIAFPPYALFYGVSQVNSLPIQGILYGLVLGLGTEAFMLPTQSLVIAMGPAFNIVIDEVNSWIKLASKPPI